MQHKDMKITFQGIVDALLFINKDEERFPGPNLQKQIKPPSKVIAPEKKPIYSPVTKKTYNLNSEYQKDDNGRLVDLGTNIKANGQAKQTQYQANLTAWDYQEIEREGLKREFAAAFKTMMADGASIKQMIDASIGPKEKPYKKSMVCKYRKAFKQAKENKETYHSSITSAPHARA